MFLEWKAVVFVVGIIISVKADSIIIWNGCKNDGKQCNIALETFRGNPEHDCRAFSSPTRKCSTNHENMDKDSDMVVTSIYNKNGEVVLRWHSSSIHYDREDDFPTPTPYHHIVPEPEWDLQPIFWKRRKRHVKKFRVGRLVTCSCTVRGETELSRRNSNGRRYHSRMERTTMMTPRDQAAQKRMAQPTAECGNGFRAGYGVKSSSIPIGLIIKRVTTKSLDQCAIMCKMEFVTQIDCVAIAFSDQRNPNCVLLSSLPKRSASNYSDYMIYTSC